MESGLLLRWMDETIIDPMRALRRRVSLLLSESLPPLSIQWFPGHMNTARKEAAKTMEVIDVVVELLDARIDRKSVV